MLKLKKFTIYMDLANNLGCYVVMVYNKQGNIKIWCTKNPWSTEVSMWGMHTSSTYLFSGYTKDQCWVCIILLEEWIASDLQRKGYVHSTFRWHVVLGSLQSTSNGKSISISLDKVVHTVPIKFLHGCAIFARRSSFFPLECNHLIFLG